MEFILACAALANVEVELAVCLAKRIAESNVCVILKCEADIIVQGNVGDVGSLDLYDVLKLNDAVKGRKGVTSSE